MLSEICVPLCEEFLTTGTTIAFASDSLLYEHFKTAPRYIPIFHWHHPAFAFSLHTLASLLKGSQEAFHFLR